MTDCTDCQDVVLEHDQTGPIEAVLPFALNVDGRFGAAYPCAVPGISLTNYSTGPAGKGWGAACGGSRTTVTLSNGVRVTVRSEIAELVELIMNANIADGYVYRQADTGAYNCRYIGGTTIWSLHAWALAVDQNWQSNPQRRPLTTDMPVWLRQRWNRYGFAWGGDYTGGSTPDAMHHEFMGTPAQAAAATNLARAELGGNAQPPVQPPVTPGNGEHVVPAGGVSDLNGTGPVVRQDQADLIDTGFPIAGGADSFWGPASVGAAKAFQHAAGLVEDGEFGPASRAAIHKVPSWRTGGLAGGYSATRWQTELRNHGWRITVDGKWGDHSKSILAQFQAEKRLRADGLPGPESWTALFTQPN